MTLQQKLLFLEMFEKPKEKLGFSRVGEGPGVQVGATWAQKSCPRGVRTTKMISNRAAGGVRIVILRSLDRLYSKKCMKNLRKSMVFEGSERVRAPKLEPLGPQSRAREGRDSQNDVEQRRKRGTSSKSWAGQVRLSVRVMEIIATQLDSDQIRGQSLSKR